MAKRKPRVKPSRGQSAATESIRERLRNTLSVAPDTASVTEIARGAASLSSSKRAQLAADCTHALLTEASRDEGLRIVLAKTVVALLPESFSQLDDLLKPDARGAAEAQFSLFVFLDESAQLLGKREERDRVLALVTRYLLNVSHGVARAPWMAGDLLGDHWPFEESTPVLMHAAMHAHFVAGREGALHGVSHALARVPKRLQWDLVHTLKRVAKEDRSARLRRYAQAILGDLRGV